MKRLFICGDSYMSPSLLAPDTHLSEIIAKELNYELTVYARGGMSNLGICLQIESAIASNPDFVLLNFTSHDRIEIPITKDSDRNYSVENIINGPLNKDSKLISDTFFCLLEGVGHFSTKYSQVKNISEIKQALKYYFEFLYSLGWKSKTDCWALYACMHKLKESKIPFLLLRHESEIEKFPFLELKNIFDPNFGKYFKSSGDPGYHTAPEDQIIISQNILDHIKKHKLLDK